MTFLSDAEGDNINFTAVTAGDYDVYLNKLGTETEFAKYPLNPQTARCLQVHADQSISIIGMNEKIFTNPSPVIINKPHIEKRNNPKIVRITLNVPTANTNINIRWF